MKLIGAMRARPKIYYVPKIICLLMDIIKQLNFTDRRNGWWLGWGRRECIQNVGGNVWKKDILKARKGNKRTIQYNIL
jgi:hypothetical protein